MASGSNTPTTTFPNLDQFQIFHQCGKANCNMVYTSAQAAAGCQHQQPQPQLVVIQASKSGAAGASPAAGEPLGNGQEAGESPGSKDALRHGGSRNLEMWSSDRTEAFLCLVRDNIHRLVNRTERSDTVWADICQGMQEHMPGVTKEQIKTKWKNVKMKYTKTRDISAFRGMPSSCFDILESIHQNYPSLDPVKRMVGLGRTSIMKSPKQYESQAETSEAREIEQDLDNIGLPKPLRPLKIEAPYQDSSRQPRQEPDDSSVDMMEVEPDISIPRKRQRVRRDAHTRRIEDEAREYVREVKRHNAAMEEMMRELVDAQKQIAEELKNRGLPTE